MLPLWSESPPLLDFNLAMIGRASALSPDTETSNPPLPRFTETEKSSSDDSLTLSKSAFTRLPLPITSEPFAPNPSPLRTKFFNSVLSAGPEASNVAVAPIPPPLDQPIHGRDSRAL